MTNTSEARQIAEARLDAAELADTVIHAIYEFAQKPEGVRVDLAARAAADADAAADNAAAAKHADIVRRHITWADVERTLT